MPDLGTVKVNNGTLTKADAVYTKVRVGCTSTVRVSVTLAIATPNCVPLVITKKK
jgi:hypothetical protein